MMGSIRSLWGMAASSFAGLSSGVKSGMMMGGIAGAAYGALSSDTSILGGAFGGALLGGAGNFGYSYLRGSGGSGLAGSVVGRSMARGNVMKAAAVANNGAIRRTIGRGSYLNRFAREARTKAMYRSGFVPSAIANVGVTRGHLRRGAGISPWGNSSAVNTSSYWARKIGGPQLSALTRGLL